MELKIQVIAQSKPAWSEGTLVLVEREKDFLGGSDLVNELPDLTALRSQFQFNPKTELAGYVAGAKSPKSVLFLSTAQVKVFGPADVLRVLGSRAVGFAAKNKVPQLTVALESASQDDIKYLLEGINTSAYSFEKYKSSMQKDARLTVTLIVDPAQVKPTQALVRDEAVIADAVKLARDLVNEIPAELYPANMAEQAKAAATGAGLKVTIYDEKRLAKENFNGILTVGRGSNKPPRLTMMEYTPKGKARKDIHLCLVGKGVTFDTGGHSLKPSKSMWEMKGDMAGGAAVIAAMTAIGRIAPSIRVTGIVPSALNAIGPDAVLPGDIIRSRSGKTVHVDNTDAEGRLLLMDALHLAQEIGATHIVDVATLTGSVVRALGEAVSGLFANDDAIAQLVVESGKAVGEEFWRLPLVEEYRSMLDHPVADIDNVGKSVNAGAIVAALFLQEFVSNDVKWAHLDIAGCGLRTSAYKCCAPGASGFGVRTLTEMAVRLGEK